MYCRCTPRFRLNASDYAITIAVITEAVTLGLTAAAVSHGLGRHDIYVTPEEFENIWKLEFSVFVIALWPSTLARISIAFMLLRIVPSVAWKVVLWGLVVVQVGDLIAADVIQLLECQPIQAMWSQVEGAVCLTSDQMHWDVYTFIVLSLLCDFVFAILPMVIIWRLNRPLLERVLVTILMMLGLLATVAASFKIYYTATIDLGAPDASYREMPCNIWMRVEENVLIIAACAPLLKAPVENALHRLGFPTFHHGERELNSLYTNQIQSSVKETWTPPHGSTDSSLDV